MPPEKKKKNERWFEKRAKKDPKNDPKNDPKMFKLLSHRLEFSHRHFLKDFHCPKFAIPPACYRSLSGPSGPKCPRSVPESVPENGGCPRECPPGGARGPSGPGLRSVQKVSRECPRSVKKVSRTLRDTLGTLFGHSGRRTFPRTPPIFGDTLGDTPGTLRARRARETPVAGRRDRNPKSALF